MRSNAARQLAPTSYYSDAQRVALWVVPTAAVGPDSTPDAFTFTDQTGVALSSTITSAAITVTGINTGATITVTGGTYDINGSGTFVSSSGTVNNGDTVRARHTSSGSFSGTVNTAVTIGGVSDTFSSTTVAADSTPDAFTFTDQSGVARSATITSAAIVIAGLNTTANISITGGTYSINGAAYSSASASNAVSNGDSITVRHTSSAAYHTAVNTVLTIGGVSDTFTSTTLSDPTAVSAVPKWTPLAIAKHLPWLKAYSGLAAAALAEANGSAVWAKKGTLPHIIYVDVHSVPGYQRPGWTF